MIESILGSQALFPDEKKKRRALHLYSAKTSAQIELKSKCFKLIRRKVFYILCFVSFRNKTTLSLLRKKVTDNHFNIFLQMVFLNLSLKSTAKYFTVPLYWYYLYLYHMGPKHVPYPKNFNFFFTLINFHQMSHNIPFDCNT